MKKSIFSVSGLLGLILLVLFGYMFGQEQKQNSQLKQIDKRVEKIEESLVSLTTKEAVDAVFSKADIDSTVLAAYHEARGESDEGIKAVVEIIYNRSQHYKKTLDAIVKEFKVAYKQKPVKFTEIERFETSHVSEVRKKQKQKYTCNLTKDKQSYVCTKEIEKVKYETIEKKTYQFSFWELDDISIYDYKSKDRVTKLVYTHLYDLLKGKHSVIGKGVMFYDTSMASVKYFCSSQYEGVFDRQIGHHYFFSCVPKQDKGLEDVK